MPLTTGFVPGLLAGFPEVTASASNDGSSATSTSRTATIPGSPVNGDLLISVCSGGGFASAPTLSVSGTGWNLFGTASSATGRSSALAYRFYSGASALTFNSTVAGYLLAATILITKNHASSPPEQAASGWRGAISPFAVTPSWGALMNLFLSIACVAGNATITGPPANYTSVIQVTPGNAQGGSAPKILIASRQLAATSAQDAWSGSSLGTLNATMAAVRPL